MPPDMAAAQEEIAKLPIEVRKVADPMIKEGIAMKAKEIAEQKQVFVNRAGTTFEKKGWAFFGTDLANRLRDIDADEYSKLVGRAYSRLAQSRSSADEAAKKQAKANAEALNGFQALGSDGMSQPGAVDTFISKFAPENGIPVDQYGRGELAKAATVAAQQRERGQLTPESQFKERVLAAVHGWRPTNPKQAGAWEKAVQAEAVNSFTAAIEADPQHRQPSAKQVQEMQAQIVHKYFTTTVRARGRPTQEMIDAEAGATALLGGGSRAAAQGLPSPQTQPRGLPQQAPTKSTPPPPKAPSGKVKVIGPGNKEMWATEAGLDDWLKNHTGFKRAP
jgi:hypothetical protein